MKLAAVVVLYNPDEERVIENIQSFINDLDLLIAIDNSDKGIVYAKLNSYLDNNKALYINNGENKGIAYALNLGAMKAIEFGSKWLLTMDQDSRVTSNMLTLIFDFINTNKNKLNIGIVSPVHLLKNSKILKKKTSEYEDKFTVMTSGNLLNLDAFIQTGKFNEKFFIDYVDHEYCLRLKKCKFSVISLNNAYLIHELGDLRHSALGTVTNHNAIRRYYITRNRLFVNKVFRKDFPEFCKHDVQSMWKELVRIIFMEKDKVNKVKYFLLGVWHYKINRFGKL